MKCPVAEDEEGPSKKSRVELVLHMPAVDQHLLSDCENYSPVCLPKKAPIQPDCVPQISHTVPAITELASKLNETTTTIFSQMQNFIELQNKKLNNLNSSIKGLNSNVANLNI